MMPLRLFTVRNFAVGNLTTLALYAGLGVATFFLVLFIQQVGGYTPLQAGLSLLPITILIFLLSRRFGMLADRLGPRVFMAGGPIVAGLGLLLLTRTDQNADYLTTILPGVLVFGLGMAATVAPLTATVLGLGASRGSPASRAASTTRSREWRDCSRSRRSARSCRAASRRASTTISRAGRSALPPARRSQARATVRSSRRTTGVPSARAPAVHAALVDASVHSFRLGMGVGAALAILGGLVALVGIENPRRRVRAADCPGGALTGALEGLESS